MQTKFNHSYYCEMDKMRNLLTKQRGVCEACDALRDVDVNNRRNRSVEIYDLTSDNVDQIYCKNAVTPYPKCTKHTYPACACGKLVYFRTKGMEGFN
jgi:hypothetical protein